MTRRVVRPAVFWREVDVRLRRAIALDAQLGTAYEHAPTCACATCETVAEQHAEVVERVEQEVRQQLACEVADDVGDA